MKLTPDIIEQVVDRMLDIWEDESRWVKGYIAQRRDGAETAYADPFAVSWCAVGTRMKAMYDLGLRDWYDRDFDRFMDYYAHQEYGVSTVVLNDRDETSFEDIRLFVKCLKDKPWPVEGVECEESSPQPA